MDPLKNPFSPGAGTTPPELVGRESILEDARVLLGRTNLGRSAKSMMLTGLRGVGKTVLLNTIEFQARQTGYQTIFIEALESKSLGVQLAPKLKAILYELDRIAGAKDKIRRGLAVLRGFIGALKIDVGDFSFGLDIEPAQGPADTGDIEFDLPNLLMAIAEAAKSNNSAIALFIDEAQFLTRTELSAVIMSMHKAQQTQLPIVLIAAGLPVLPGLAGNAKSYSERLFEFPDIGALSEADSVKAIKEPLNAAGIEITGDALQEIFKKTRGYPYFLQEWGYQSWNLAAGSPITKKNIQSASQHVTERLDANFFRVRFNRITPSEKNFLRAMAEFDTQTIRAGDILEKLKITAPRLSPVRASLIKKGMIYSPSHGELAFTVPLFAEFMRRMMPVFVA